MTKSVKKNKKRDVARNKIWEDIEHNTGKVQHGTQSEIKRMGREKRVRRSQQSNEGLPRWRAR